MFMSVMKEPILNQQQGSALLEALMAILIFSIGILAIVGLQATSISNASASKTRVDASLLANQIIGQMWVSDPATLATNFAGAQGVGGPNFVTWSNNVAQILPGDSTLPAYLPQISFSGNVATITLKWLEPGGQAHQYVVTATINQ
jgi:type IV pilus assembly protein PilV